MANANPNRPAFGKFDTREGWGTACHTTSLASDLVSNNTTNNLFRTVSVFNFLVIFVYAQIRVFVMASQLTGAAIAYFVCEVLAFGVPADRQLDRQAADDRIVADVRRYFPLVNKGYRAEHLTAARAAVNSADWTDATITAGAAPDNMSYGQAVALLQILATARYQNNRIKVAASLFVTFLCSVAKMGNMTGRYLAKITGSMESESGIVLDEDIFNADVCRTVWNTIKVFVTPNFVEQAVNRWTANGFFPDTALRLRLVAQQIAGEGLTALGCIKLAMTRFADFPWQEVAQLMPDEAQRVAQAFQAVGNNAYYGFSSDLGPARSTLYKSWAWVAKELLIRVGGMGSLNQYRGWTRTPQKMHQLEVLIENYINHPPAPAAIVPGDQNHVAVQNINTHAQACTGVPAMN